MLETILKTGLIRSVYMTLLAALQLSVLKLLMNQRGQTFAVTVI